MFHIRHTNHYPLAMLVRGFVFLPLLLLACTNSMEEVQETTGHYEPAMETGKNITLLFNEDGQQRVRLTAPVIVQHKTEEPYIEFPEGLTVWFYNDSLQRSSTLRANYAIRYEKEQQTIFRDSVLIYNVNNEEVYTEEMTWDEKEERVYGEQFIRIVTPEERLTGKGFEANQDFTEYTILQITGQVYVESNAIDEDL